MAQVPGGESDALTELRAARQVLESRPVPPLSEVADHVEAPLSVLERHASGASQDPRLAADWELLLNWILYAILAHNQMAQGDVRVHVEGLQRRIHEALRLRQVSARGETIVYLARLRRVLGQFALLAEEAPREFERIEDPVQKGVAWIWLLEAFSERRDVARALPLLERFGKLRDARMGAKELLKYEILHSLALALAGALDRSAEVWIDAERRWMSLPNPPDPSIVGFGRMDWLLACEQYEDAIPEAAAILARESTKMDDRDRAHLGLAIAHARSGRDAEARESLRAIETATNVYGRRARGELARLALRRGDLVEARRWIEQSERSDALDDPHLVPLAWLVVGELSAGRAPTVPPEELELRLRGDFASMLAAWDGLPIDQSGHAFLQLGVRRDLLSALFALILARTPGEPGINACLDLLLEAEARGSTARTLALPARRFGELRSTLVPPGRAMLVYVPALAASWCFGVSEERLVAARLESDGELRRIARESYERLHDASAPAADARWADVASQAFRWCFPTEIQALVDECHELAIVGGEMLQPLPLGALPWRESSLGCAKALMDLPSLTLAAAWKRREQVSRDLDLAVIAATAIDARDAAAFGVTSLPLGIEDLERIADGLAPERVAIRVAGQRQDFRSGVGSAAAVSVCLAHGLSKGTAGDADVVVLGRSAEDDTGALLPADIERAPELLLLLSCSSGSARLRRGEDGGQRLVGRVLLQGASAVIAADGPLELSAACHLARAFLRELTAGAPAAEALRRAKLDTASQPAWRHPRYYAHLRLIGEGGTRFRLHPADPDGGATLGAALLWIAVGSVIAGLGCFGLLWRVRARARVT